MIDFTKFFKLKKPDEDEFYDVALNNENMDTIDMELKNAITQLATKANTTEVNAQLATKAPVNSPAFTGTATLGGKEIPTIESAEPTLLNGWKNARDYNHLKVTRTGNTLTLSGAVTAGVDTPNTKIIEFPPSFGKGVSSNFVVNGISLTTKVAMMYVGNGALISSSDIVSGNEYSVIITVPIK